MSADTGTIVVEHALETARNLATALEVGAHYEAIRFGAMKQVLDRLECRINAASAVDRWESECGGEIPSADENLFRLIRPDFGEELYSGLCPWSNEARTMSYFVFVGVDSTPDIDAERALLRQALNSALGRGRKSPGCPWYKPLDAPFDDWGDSANLVQLYEDAALSDGIADRLIHVTKVAEHHLERIAALARVGSGSGDDGE